MDMQAAPAYPTTPPIAAVVRRQLSARRVPASRLRLRLVWAAALALVAFVVLLLVSPDVREAVARFFGLNTVRIQQVPTLEAPEEIPVTALPIVESTAQATVKSTPGPITPGPTGLTTLADARAKAPFEIRLPTYPTGLGQPAQVYYQDFAPDIRGAQQVILIYPDFALYEAIGILYQKSIGSGTLVTETKVGGRAALWLSGAEHMIEVQDSAGRTRIDFTRFVEGNVLAWEVGEITYRIETRLSLEEVIRIAESIE